MASRLGFTPREWRAMTPAEIKALWDGYWWRQSRQMEVAAECVFWIRSMLDSKVRVKKITDRMKTCGYEPNPDVEKARRGRARKHEE